MGRIVLTLAIAISMLRSAVVFAAPEPIDFVIDLDQVLIHHLSPGVEAPRSTQVITVAGERYWVANGAGEFLQSLLGIPGGRISFNSAGGEARNLEALAQIRLPSGMTALQAATLGAARPRLISGMEPGVKFKDVMASAPGMHAERTFLVDDTAKNVKPGQEENYVRVFEPSGMGNYRKGDDPAVHFTANNELVRVRGLIDAALEYSRNHRVSPTRGLQAVQWEAPVRAGKELPDLQASTFSVDIYRRGLRQMKAANGRFTLTTLAGGVPGSIDCMIGLIRAHLGR
jgi:hypothetical protein